MNKMSKKLIYAFKSIENESLERDEYDSIFATLNEEERNSLNVKEQTLLMRSCELLNERSFYSLIQHKDVDIHFRNVLGFDALDYCLKNDYKDDLNQNQNSVIKEMVYNIMYRARYYKRNEPFEKTSLEVIDCFLQLALNAREDFLHFLRQDSFLKQEHDLLVWNLIVSALSKYEIEINYFTKKGEERTLLYSAVLLQNLNLTTKLIQASADLHFNMFFDDVEGSLFNNRNAIQDLAKSFLDKENEKALKIYTLVQGGEKTQEMLESIIDQT